ncbi:hypothetical protein VTP01DRAFT_4910 [Rhizomucor pusillus]|uniref:uncharacterized protein n=1 Tax=Rhizomucor pusillus TaxID=4840 RepID=UPI0037422F1E
MDISVFYVEILQLSLFLLASSVIEFNYIIIIIKEVKITVMDYAFVFVKSRAYSLGRRSDKLKFEGAVLAIASAMNLDRKLCFQRCYCALYALSTIYCQLLGGLEFVRESVVIIASLNVSSIVSSTFSYAYPLDNPIMICWTFAARPKPSANKFLAALLQTSGVILQSLWEAIVVSHL